MVFIKGLDGVSRTYQIGPETTVAQLKQLIEQAEGIPDDEQRLLLAGKTNEQIIEVSGVFTLELNMLEYFLSTSNITRKNLDEVSVLDFENL